MIDSLAVLEALGAPGDEEDEEDWLSEQDFETEEEMLAASDRRAAERALAALLAAGATEEEVADRAVRLVERAEAWLGLDLGREPEPPPTPDARLPTEANADYLRREAALWALLALRSAVSAVSSRGLAAAARVRIAELGLPEKTPVFQALGPDGMTAAVEAARREAFGVAPRKELADRSGGFQARLAWALAWLDGWLRAHPELDRDDEEAVDGAMRADMPREVQRTFVEAEMRRAIEEVFRERGLPIDWKEETVEQEESKDPAQLREEVEGELERAAVWVEEWLAAHPEFRLQEDTVPVWRAIRAEVPVWVGDAIYERGLWDEVFGRQGMSAG